MECDRVSHLYLFTLGWGVGEVPVIIATLLWQNVSLGRDLGPILLTNWHDFQDGEGFYQPLHEKQDDCALAVNLKGCDVPIKVVKAIFIGRCPLYREVSWNRATVSFV